jgi:CheY-like chemotaxis protein
MLAVSDTGQGMDRDTLTHLFEPFYTTKEVGRGTGLGLATVYGIVKQSGGNIWVYSEPDRGTTFKVYVPRVDEPVEELAPQALDRAALRGSETILIVEDEDQVRTLVRRVLESKGYTVLESNRGLTAIELAERHNAPIHLLVTDVVMPHMSGRALATALTAVRPSMRVLYMSGYTSNAIVHRGVLDPNTPFLQKPFMPDALASKVREILD